MKAKLLSTVLLMILISSIFVACGQARGICDICSKNAKLWEVTVNESIDLLGVTLAEETTTYNVCEDCKEDLMKDSNITAKPKE